VLSIGEERADAESISIGHG